MKRGTSHLVDDLGPASASADHPLGRLAQAMAEDLIRQGCDRLDASIDRALHGMGEILGIDRCCLVQPGQEPDRLNLTHEWRKEHLAVPTLPPGPAGQPFEWLADRMRRREQVCVASVAALAEQDEAGATELAAHGFGSVLALPLWREEVFRGWLTLATVARETTWDETCIPPLERIATMLAGALEHQQTTRELTARNVMLEQFGNRLWQLHRVQTRSYQDPAALLKAYLEAGSSIFGLPTGIVSRIEEDAYVLQAVSSDLEALVEGATFVTGDTYCAEVVRTGKTIAYHHVGAMPGMKGHPVYVGLGLESYISTPISVRGVLFGTLNFSSTAPRAEPFSLQDRELIELMAESIARFIELRDTEAERDRLAREGRAAEEERRELLERTEQLSALAVLAAGVAHEINNPLQGMLSHLKTLQGRLSDDETCLHSLEMVEKGIQSIAEIVRQLLALSAEPDQPREPAEAGLASAYVSQLLGPQFARNRVEVENRVAEGGARLAIDQRELIQVLTNLLLNARDAMPDGGVVRLESEAGGDTTILRVLDNGTGIDPAIRSQVFTPFFTTKGARGTGLGLSVADSIVRRSGGALEMDSTPGRGTIFTLRLPHGRKPGRGRNRT